MKMVEGLRSQTQWKLDREDEIGDAVARYVEAGLEIPDQWLDELFTLQMQRPEIQESFKKSFKEGIVQKMKEEQQ